MSSQQCSRLELVAHAHPDPQIDSICESHARYRKDMVGKAYSVTFAAGHEVRTLTGKWDDGDVLAGIAKIEYSEANGDLRKFYEGHVLFEPASWTVQPHGIGTMTFSHGDPLKDWFWEAGKAVFRTIGEETSLRKTPWIAVKWQDRVVDKSREAAKATKVRGPMHITFGDRVDFIHDVLFGSLPFLSRLASCR